MCSAKQKTGSARAPLVVIGMTGPEAVNLARALGLEDTGLSWHLCTDPEVFWALELDGPADLVVVFSGCTAFVTRHMQAGMPPQAALARWQEAAEAVLALVRRMRRQVLVLDDAHVLAAPDEIRRILNSRFQRRLRGVLHEVTGPAPDPVPASYTLLAAETLRRDARARRMQAELQASCQGIETDADAQTADPDAAFAEMADWARAHAPPGPGQARSDGETTALHERIATLQRELNTMRDALHLATEQDAALRRARDALSRDLDTARADQARQGTEAARDLQWLQGQADALKARLAEAARALETARGEVQEIEDRKNKGNRWLQQKLARALSDHAAAQNLLAERDALIEELYASTSWRITGPMRSLRRLTMREGGGDG